MLSLASSPGARRVLWVSIVARLPLTMLSIGLLVHAQRLTGSFAAGGLVTAGYAVALGVGGPVLGQLADRRGQTVVLVPAGAVTAALLLAVALLPAGAPLGLIVALAAGIGLASPPVGACLRALLPALVPEPGALRAAYAVEASAVEVTWVAGPPLALAAGALWSTGAALAAAGVVVLLATAAFAAEPASRRWRPATGVPRLRGGSLRKPAMRTLVLVMVAIGALFGGVEVAITAASEAHQSAAAAAPLLSLWGLGSLAGGLLAARRGGLGRGAAGLALVLAVLGAAHLALIAVAGSLAGLAAVLLLAGAAIAPTYAVVYAMVDDACPAGTVTEAFAWLATATAVGAAVGAAVAGAAAQHAGPAAAFALAGTAGVGALLTAMARARTLPAAPAGAAAQPAAG